MTLTLADPPQAIFDTGVIFGATFAPTGVAARVVQFMVRGAVAVTASQTSSKATPLGWKSVARGWGWPDGGSYGTPANDVVPMQLSELLGVIVATYDRRLIQ